MAGSTVQPSIEKRRSSINRSCLHRRDPLFEEEQQSAERRRKTADPAFSAD